MVDGAEPVCFTKRPALVIRYRDERRVWKLADDFRQSGQIQSSVQGRHERHAQPAEQRQMQPINVTVDDIELGHTLGDSFEQRRLGGDGVRARPAKAKRARPDRDEGCSSGRIPAGKKSDVVSKSYQLVCQPGDDALGTAVELRRYAFR